MHRRKIYTEEKAKVVAAIWGTECASYFALGRFEEQDELHQDCLKEIMNHLIHPIVLGQNS